MVGKSIKRLLLRASLIFRPRPALSAANEIALFEGDTVRRGNAMVIHLDATSDSLTKLMDETDVLRSVFDRVIYVIDFPDFDVLREQGCIFEYVPSRVQQAEKAQDAPWREFLTARYELLVAKWVPVAIVSFGPSWANWVRSLGRSGADRGALDLAAGQ